MRHKRDEPTPDQRVARLARRRHGVVTTGEMLALGLSRAGIQRRVRAQRLQRLFQSVFFVGAGPVSPEAWWMAGVLCAGPGAALCGESAAGLWRMLPILIRPVHVVVPPPRNRRSRPGLIVHRSITLLESDVTRRNRIPVTTPHRTVLDLPRHLRDRAVNQALVDSILTSHPAARRPMTRSRAERSFLRFCKKHCIPEPDVNEEIAGRERDFSWPEHVLVVEMDGPHHDHEPQRRLDRARDRELTRRGWRVLRYAEEELGARAAAEILALLA